MRQILPTALLALTAVACSGSSENKPDRSEGTVVRIGDLRSETPKDWKKEEPREGVRTFRAYQFRLAGAAGDAELIVFRNIGGSAEANVDRWKKQFTPPEGKKPEEVIKVTKRKVGDYAGLYLDASGTYNSGMPSGPQGPQPDYRMLGVCIDVPDKPSQVVLRGPAATVEKYKKEFDDWLKAFK